MRLILDMLLGGSNFGMVHGGEGRGVGQRRDVQVVHPSDTTPYTSSRKKIYEVLTTEISNSIIVSSKIAVFKALIHF